MNTTTIQNEVRMLIDGELVEAASGKTFDVISPATEEVLGQVADADKEDMQRAIAAARRAFDETDWSTNKELRKRCLLQLQEAIESERELLRAELVAEVGTPVSLTYGPQLDGPLDHVIPYQANMIDDFQWERDLGEGEFRGTISRRWVEKVPVGVVGAIVPWNFPFEVSISKLAPALATGNTVVLKPAPDTPWNATRLGRLIAEHTDIPAGVVNVVTSSDHLVGEELVIDPRVDMISFTGSTAVGRRIMEKGALTMKRLFLELGGKSAMVVLDDANFQEVLPAAAAVATHAGQGCAIQTRLLLPRSRYQEGVAMLKAIFPNIPYGDPNDKQNICGPVISAKQRDRVMSHIKNGIAEGATLAAGGQRPSHLPKGNYIEPTLFVDVDNSMSIAQEEIFGPVLVVIPYDDDDDAVRIANDSDYGLGGGVYSASAERSIAVAQGIRAGGIGMNGGAAFGPDVPFGGFKASGIGRQNGIEGFDQYLETKSLAIRL